MMLGIGGKSRLQWSINIQVPTDIAFSQVDSVSKTRVGYASITIVQGDSYVDIVGNNLADLHFKGHIPHYAQQLQRPLDRFLLKLKVESPIHRNSQSYRQVLPYFRLLTIPSHCY